MFGNTSLENIWIRQTIINLLKQMTPYMEMLGYDGAGTGAHISYAALRGACNWISRLS